MQGYKPHGETHETIIFGDCVYYWSVRAYDGTEYNEGSPVWSFTLDTQNPATPVIESISSDVASGAITAIGGTGDDGSTLSFYDGAGAPIAGTTSWDGSGGFTLTPDTPLPSGTGVTVVSQDEASNVSESPLGVIDVDYTLGDYMDGLLFRGAS